MKLSFLSLLLVMLALGSSAQRLQMNDTTNRWDYARRYETVGHTFKYAWSFWCADSAIHVNGKEYGRIRHQCGASSIPFRDDTAARKLYVWDATTNTDVLIMDYNLNDGDSFTATYNTTSITWGVSVDTVMINGYPHKTLRLSIDMFNTGYSSLGFIEGIGFTTIHPLAVWDQLMSPYPNMNGVPQLACFKSNNQLYVENTQYTGKTCWERILDVQEPQRVSHPGVYPQPASEKATLVLPARVADAILTVSDMQGRIVQTQHLENTAIAEITNNHNLSGIYFYRVTGTNTAYSGKIVFR
jgi:hypothetical protein